MAPGRESILMGGSVVAKGLADLCSHLNTPGNRYRIGSRILAGILDNVSKDRELSSNLHSSFSAS